MAEYKIKAEKIDHESIVCPHCGSTNTTRIQYDQLACKSCRSLWFRTVISDEEMIEWFVE
jgi:ribosomal protein L37AE/L43A